MIFPGAGVDVANIGKFYMVLIFPYSFSLAFMSIVEFGY